MVSKTNQLPDGLAQLELADLLAFNSQITKLSAAGVPIRFSGAPNSLADWLQGISSRVAVHVGSGQSATAALATDPLINPAYLSALATWLETRDSKGGANPDAIASTGSLKALDGWVQTGISGNRQIDKSGVYAFWLWILALIASIVMIHSVWVMFPKLRQFYENSGLETGAGYHWIEWFYNRLSLLGLTLAALLIAAPFLWRIWLEKIAKHWSISSNFARGFFLAYLVLGGVMTAISGWTVFWPVVELLIAIGEPRS